MVKSHIVPYKAVIIEDGLKVFKESGSKEKVTRGLQTWLKTK